MDYWRSGGKDCQASFRHYALTVSDRHRSPSNWKLTKIMTPTEYWCSIGRNCSKPPESPFNWCSDTVANIPIKARILRGHGQFPKHNKVFQEQNEDWKTTGGIENLSEHPSCYYRARGIWVGAGTPTAPPQTDQKRNCQPFFGTALLCGLWREAVLQRNRKLQTRWGVFLLLLVSQKFRCVFRPLYP